MSGRVHSGTSSDATAGSGSCCPTAVLCLAITRGGRRRATARILLSRPSTGSGLSKSGGPAICGGPRAISGDFFPMTALDRRRSSRFPSYGTGGALATAASAASRIAKGETVTARSTVHRRAACRFTSFAFPSIVVRSNSHSIFALYGPFAFWSPIPLSPRQRARGSHAELRLNEFHKVLS